MAQTDVQTIARALADGVYKRTGGGPGPFKVSRDSLYDFSQRTHFREAFLAELSSLLEREHAVHMLEDREFLYFIHRDYLRSWRTLPRRLLVARSVGDV